jgi:hypothetical protein
MKQKTLKHLYQELRMAQIHKFVTYFDFNIEPYLNVELSHYVPMHKAKLIRQYILDTFPQVTQIQLQMLRNPDTWQSSPCMKIWTTSDNFALDIE